MGYTQRQDARNADSITTYDSTSLGPGAYVSNVQQSCSGFLISHLLAVKGAGALVQSRSSASANNPGTVSGGTLAFSNPNAGGNCLIVTVGFGGSFPGNAATCTDSQGNVYTQVQNGHEAGFYFWTFIAFGSAAGANTVSVAFTGAGVPGGRVSIAISEYGGGTAVDDSTSNGQIGVGVSTCTVNTTAGGDLLYLAVGIESVCAGSPFGVSGGNPLNPPTPPQAWLIVNEPPSGSPATGGGLTDRSSYLFTGEGGQKHSFNLKLRERGTANYTLVSDPNRPDTAPFDYEPTMGQPIYLYDQNASGYFLEFAGLIQDFTIRWTGIGGLRYIDCTAVSLESVFDTVYARPMQFVNQTCGAILTALFNAFENGCPVGLGLIQAGATIPLFNANLGDKLSDLFDQLATTSEFTWGVNPATQLLYFCLPTATAAPFTVTSTNVLWDSISQKFDNADYRNRQAVKLSFDAFPHSEEHFVGSGQQNFTLMRPVEQVVAAYVTTATPGSATASFSGQPSPGDTITIGPDQGAWQASHIYALGGYIVVGGFVFQVTIAGTSGSSEPNFLANTVTGDTVGDNSVVWTCRGTATLGSVFTSYEFVAALDNTQYGQILIGSTLAQTVQNTVDALNATAPYSGTPATLGKGLTFSLPTWENSQVNAISVTGSGFTVTQKIPGSGNIAGLASTGTAFAWSGPNTTGGTSPQTAVGPNEPAWLSIAVYVAGTSTAAPGLVYTPGSANVQLVTPLNTGTNLVVEYTRTDGNVIEVEDTPLVAALAAISHGTGKYQQSTDQSSTGLIDTSAAAGLQLAQQILATFDITQQKFELDFYRPGILPGQVLTLDLNSPLSVMNGSYLVLSMKAQMVYKYPYLDSAGVLHGGHYRYTAELINVNLIGTDLAFWLGLGGGGSGGGGGGGGGGALVATSGSTGQISGNGPGGSSPQVQYNTGAAFGGISGATSDGTNLLVTTQPPGTNNTTAASTAFVEAALGTGALALAKYTTSWSAQTSVTVTHNLNSRAVMVQVFDASGNVVTPQNIAITSANVITLTFGVSFTGSVVVIAAATVTPSYSTSWTAQTSVTVTHNLGSLDPLVMVYDAAGNQVAAQNVAVTSPNVVTLTFGVSFTGSVVAMALSVVRQATASWTSQTTVAISHNLGTTAVVVQVYDGSGNQVTPQNAVTTDANTVTLTFGVSFTGSAVVIG